MKLVAISDIHGYVKGLTVPKCDLLLIAGDVGRHGKDIFSDGNWLASRFNPWLEQQPAKHIVMVPGNHDVVFERALKTVPKLSCHVLMDELIEIDGLKIYGSPWSLEFYNWGFNLSEEKLKLVWDKIPEGIDILLVHSPPYGILDLTNNPRYEPKHIGSKGLIKKVNEIKPKYVIFGHNHGEHGEIVKDGITFVNASLLNESYEMVHKPIVIEI